MRIVSVSLESFRNIKGLRTELSKGINIVYGDNAQGKTNFLEAIYFCALGRSKRTSDARELINFGCSEAIVRTVLDREGASREIDAQIRAEGRGAAKNIAVDRLPVKKTNELFGLLLVVVFSPDELRLIKAGPSERRAFMDMELCQISPVYCHELKCYHHALKQRNSLLKSISTGGDGEETLSVWDAQLCKYGRRVTSFRSDFVKKADAYASEIHAYLTGGAESLEMRYDPSVAEPDAYEEIIAKNRANDLRRASTTAGAHKDDIRFMINGEDARAYGSQGQQRTAALSAKLAEIEIIKEDAGTDPVLLLDDVLSELDESRQRHLLARMANLQTVITCTGVEDVLSKKAGAVDEANVMRMADGVLLSQ